MQPCSYVAQAQPVGDRHNIYSALVAEYIIQLVVEGCTT